MKINPVDDVPWGDYITLSGRLTDASEAIPLDGKEIKLRTAYAPIDWNTAPLPTKTRNGGNFRVSLLTKRQLSDSVPWGITLRFPGDEEWSESSSNRVEFRTLAHKTELVLVHINDGIPPGQQITFTASLKDITTNTRLAGRKIYFSGIGVFPRGHPYNVPVLPNHTTTVTDQNGIATFTGVVPNVPDPELTYQAHFKAESNDHGYYYDVISSKSTYRVKRVETVVVLELGRSTDSKAFVTKMGQLRVLNATPPAGELFSEFPTPIDTQWSSFSNASAPNWWIKRFIQQYPTWLYLSGHYTGLLYNNNTSFKLDFQNPTADNNILWKHYQEANRIPTQSNYHLYDQCKVVIIMGCNAIRHLTATLNIQKIVSKNGNKPIILGFYNVCPTTGTENLISFFVEELATNWENRLRTEHIISSWLKAGKRWKSNAIGYIDNDGKAYKIRIVGNTWSWISTSRQ